jgi:hypothetical protein
MLFVASSKLSLEIMITWTANENIWYDSILIATNVISNTLEYVYGFFLSNILMSNLKKTTFFVSKMHGKNIFTHKNSIFLTAG